MKYANTIGLSIAMISGFLALGSLMHYLFTSHATHDTYRIVRGQGVYVVEKIRTDGRSYELQSFDTKDEATDFAIKQVANDVVNFYIKQSYKEYFKRLSTDIEYNGKSVIPDYTNFPDSPPKYKVPVRTPTPFPSEHGDIILIPDSHL